MPTAMPAAPFASRFGKRARQDDGFGFLPVVGRAEIDRVLIDAGQHRLRDLGQARLGVPHGGGIIAVDIAEVALALDQRVAGGEILRHAHHGVIDRGVAVRMVFAHHVADDSGAFLEAGGGVKPQLVHRVDQAAVHRFQPVAHVRQRAGHDGRERIGEIALGQRVLEVGFLDKADQIIRHFWSRLSCFLSHGSDSVVQHRTGLWQRTMLMAKCIARQEMPGQA